MKRTHTNSNIKSAFLKYFIFSSALLLAQTSSGQLSTYTHLAGTSVVLENISSGNTQLIYSAADDVNSAIQNIGFIFNFGGSTYTQFSVNSNGLLRLGSTIVSTSGLNQLTNTSDMPKIAPYWDDLATGLDGHVRYKLVGSSPNSKLVIEWKVTVPKNINNNAAATFQVWLFETTNVIEFVYGTGFVTNFTGGGYTIGLAKSSSDFISVTASSNLASTTVENNGNTGTIINGRRHRFSPPAATGIPACALNQVPAHNSTGINLTPVLSWSAGPGVPAGYDVYFGTTPNPPLVSSAQVTTTYNVSGLTWNTNYYWKVVPLNSFGDAMGCQEFQFTTAPLLSYEVTRTTGNIYNSIATTGNSFSAWKGGTNNTDDNLSEIASIGFPFKYQDAYYTEFLVSTNGFITFNTSTSSNGSQSTPYNYNNANLSNSGVFPSPAIIAPFYEDMVCQGNPQNMLSLSTSMLYETTGTIGNRVLTVEWIGMEIYNHTGPNLNFQLKLYEATDQIEFIYGKMEGFNGTTSFPYNYSVGLNAVSVSTPIASGELITQQTINSRNFSGTPSNSLSAVPECHSKITFTPGLYSPYTAPPVLVVNNNSSGAIVLPVNADPCVDFCGTYFSSANATNSGLSSCVGNPDDDVWFRFTATNPATTIRVGGSGTYNPVVELLSSSMTSIVCSDATGTGLTETINATSLVSGEDYFVRVYHSGSGWGSSMGMFLICINATPLPPSNDECSDAIELIPTMVCSPVQGSLTIYATQSLNIPVCTAAGTNPDDDVWYYFTAVSNSETITVQSAAGFNAVLQVFEGDCNNLIPLNCINNSSTGGIETISYSNLSVGEKYYVRVYHNALGSGSGQFTICVTSPPPPCTNGFNPPQATSNVTSSGIYLSWNDVPTAFQYTVYMDTVNPPTTPIGVTNGFALHTGQLQQGATYYWRVEPSNTVGSATGCPNIAFATEPISHPLRIKFFIEGFYRGTDSLVAAILPGSTDTIADTVTISLARKTAPFDKMYSYKALYTTYGVATAYFSQPILGQDYYLVVNHRNTLETWSRFPFGFNDPDTLYNFTDSIGKAFGNNMIEIDSGVYAFHSGDIDQNNIINQNDFDLLQSKVGIFAFGYLPEDLTGDWLVESADYSLIENKVQQSISRQKP